MIFSEKHKFIFFANTKTGTTSIEQALRGYDEGGFRFATRDYFWEKHIPPSMVRAIMPKTLWDECFKFVFVRNPYDWLVSQWFHNFRRSPVLSGDWKNRVRLRLYHSYRQQMRVEGRRIKDLAVVDRFERDDILFLNSYLHREFQSLPYYREKNQRTFLLDVDCNLIVDFVGRFENLEEDFGRIVDRLGLDVSLPKINTSRHDDYRRYYTPEAAEAAYSIWKEDFEVLGYPADLHAGRSGSSDE